jgi:uncharacterized protein
VTSSESAREGVSVQFDAPARMRDGTILRANVYRPAGYGPWPTLLTRLPYGKDDARIFSMWLDPVQAAHAGFMVVVQDTRGCGSSEGEWLPFRFERNDGYDTVEWAARLAGSSGRVGMFGFSYFGSTQWMAAIEQPPSLHAIAPGLTWSEPLDGLFARGGAVELGLTLPWTLMMGVGHVLRLPLAEIERARRVEAILDDYDSLPSAGYWDLPVNDMAVLGRHALPDLGTIATRNDPEVASWSRVAGNHKHAQVPSLNIGGWYDVCLQGTLDNYAAMAALGRPTRLVVGPWSHDEALGDPIGQLCFGVRSGTRGVPTAEMPGLVDLQLDWFTRHLTDRPEPPPETEAPVRIFVMGANEWRDEMAWPPARARPRRWFLGPDGSLSRVAPSPVGAFTEFEYDPRAPVPTVGGHIVMEPWIPSGAFEQSRVEERADVCVFTSDPLVENLEVIGRVRAVLHAASSAPATDWVVRLCDVHPDGRSFNVCDGIVRVETDADEPHALEVSLWSTCIEFRTGHRLRVHVTSSSFPRWDRNLNTGNQRAKRLESARQRVFHETARASWIELPVIE